MYDDLPDLSLEMQGDLLDFILHKVLGAAAGKHAKTIRSLIPDNPRKLKKVLDAGGTFLYRYPDLIRQETWLLSSWRDRCQHRTKQRHHC